MPVATLGFLVDSTTWPVSRRREAARRRFARVQDRHPTDRARGNAGRVARGLNAGFDEDHL